MFHENLISFIGDIIHKKYVSHFEQAALIAFSFLFKTETKGCFILMPKLSLKIFRIRSEKNQENNAKLALTL